MNQKIIFNYKQYVGLYPELLNDFLLKDIDYEEIDFLDFELRNYRAFYANTITDYYSEREYFDVEHNVFIVDNRSYPIVSEVSEYANKFKGSYDTEGYDLLAFKFKKIIEFLEQKKHIIVSNSPSKISDFLDYNDEFENMKSNLVVPDPGEQLKNNTLYTSSINFYECVNKSLVSELDILNFIDEATKNDLSKLETLHRDLEDFEINFTASEVVKSYFNEKVHSPISISEKFLKFKEIVLSKIVKQELEKESNIKVPDPELINNDIKNYKNQNLFKVGLLFATGEMNKYFQVNSVNAIVLNPGYNAPSIAKELNNSVNDKYILAAINNYDNNKNIFNSLEMMNKIIWHCKEENLPIDAYFHKRFVEYKKQY